MEYPLIIPAFIAGLLTFLAPCTLPLVPAYLAFISGASVSELRDAERARAVRRSVFLNGLAFVVGWSAVFIFFGTLAGLAGAALVPYRLWLVRIGGAFVILFGLFMLDVIKIPFLARERQLKVWSPFTRGPVTNLPSDYFLRDASPAGMSRRILGRLLRFVTGRGNPANSLILGTAFGAGWTPCVGPILGSILLLAGTSATAGQGALLLSVFSLGLAVPFLIIAAGIGSAARCIERFSGSLRIISVIGGLFLVGLGILLLTNNMALLISYGYRIFRFLEYERLLNYL